MKFALPLIAVSSVLVLGPAANATDDALKILRQGAAPSVTGSSEYFTGTVSIANQFPAMQPGGVSGALVTFEPEARTAWHRHPLGQTLFVTEGLGRVQREGGQVEEIRPGDIVRIAPGEKHWHGASPLSSMTHIAVQEVDNGTNVEWLEHVTDAEYQAVAQDAQ